MSELVFKNISKIFGGRVRALDGFSLEVEKGELMVLLGPSGCGKSTLLRMTAGLEEPTGGDILLRGQSIRAVPPPLRPFALVFQNYALYPHLTAEENLTFSLRVHKLPGKEINRRLAETRELLRLDRSELKRKPAELSGGQRQRVALGKALMRKPQVFLLDEPLSNLDQKLRLHLRSELRRIQRALQATMLLVTHDQNEAMAVGDRIAVIQKGRLEQAGTPGELYQNPRSMFVADFMGSPPMNLISGFVESRGGKAHFREAQGGGISFALPAGRDWHGAGHSPREVVLGIRPEAVRPAPLPGGHGRARVKDVELLGPIAYMHLDSGAHRITGMIGKGGIPPLGCELDLFLDLDQLFLFDPADGSLLNGPAPGGKAR